MLAKLLHTEPDRTLAWLRVIAGTVMFIHGAQKVLGWYGGPGYAATMQGFVSMGIPAPLAVMAILTEFFGAIALIAGLLGRLASLMLAVHMTVAVALVHLPYGFFMNWTGKQGGEGFEYHILFGTAVVPIIVRGAGAWSVDRWLERRMRVPHKAAVGEFRGAHAH